MQLCMVYGCHGPATKQANFKVFVSSPAVIGNLPVNGQLEVYCCSGCASQGLALALFDNNEDLKARISRAVLDTYLVEMGSPCEIWINWPQSFLSWVEIPGPAEVFKRCG